MKTVIIYETFTEALKFYVADGDYSHLDKVFINSIDSDNDKQDELSNLFYDQQTGDFTEFAHSGTEEFPVQAVKDGAIVIVAGFLP